MYQKCSIMNEQKRSSYLRWTRCNTNQDQPLSRRITFVVDYLIVSQISRPLKHFQRQRIPCNASAIESLLFTKFNINYQYNTQVCPESMDKKIPITASTFNWPMVNWQLRDQPKHLRGNPLPKDNLQKKQRSWLQQETQIDRRINLQKNKKDWNSQFSILSVEIDWHS